MTGVELIAKERQEQIKKHGFDLEHDLKQNGDEQLSLCAAYLILSESPFYPDSWDQKFFQKMEDKDDIGRLVVAGALIAAEIDRIQAVPTTVANGLRKKRKHS